MIQSDLGHKYAYITLNSDINPERKELNLYEEKNEKNKWYKYIKK